MAAIRWVHTTPSGRRPLALLTHSRGATWGARLFLSAPFARRGVVAPRSQFIPAMATEPRLPLAALLSAAPAPAGRIRRPEGAASQRRRLSPTDRLQTFLLVGAVPPCQ